MSASEDFYFALYIFTHYYYRYYFLYPWVYSFQGLKAIKTVLVWLLVRIVLGHEGVVQKNCIESLQCHGRTPDTLLIL